MQKKILVIDDSPVVLTMFEDMLVELSYRVTAAANGVESCRLVEFPQ